MLFSKLFFVVLISFLCGGVKFHFIFHSVIKGNQGRKSRRRMKPAGGGTHL